MIRNTIHYYGLLNGQLNLFQLQNDDFTWTSFEKWIKEQKYVQFDIETDVTPYVRERKIITVQFGSVNQKERVQYVFQWSFLNASQKDLIKWVLEHKHIQKLIQNAVFEVSTMLNVGIRIRNVYDTMLVERVLVTGYEGEFQISTALEEIVYRRLFITMIKDEQMSFGDNIITSNKIRYAAADVQHLDAVRNLQLIDLHAENLEFVAALENESVIGFAQMHWEGIELDKDEWLANVDWAIPAIEEAEMNCDEWLKKPPFRSKALELGYLAEEDRLQINWNSNDHKRRIVAKLWPDAPGATKAVLTKYLGKVQDYDKQLLLSEYLLGNFKAVEKELMKDKYRNWLIEMSLLWPKNDSKINWNSTDQVLPLLQVVDRGIRNMNEESMGKFSHPIGIEIEHYKERLKLTTTYGEDFFKHLHPDGRIRTQFNQILSTGRISSKGPNMQNIPAKKYVGMRYRHPFKPPKGFRFVSSDYVSQELVVIAYLTKDPNWIEALRKGQDLHSIASELVFRDKNNPFKISWKEAADEGCAYYQMKVNTEGKLEMAKQKCSCKRHGAMRDACKTINFGLAYGMSEFKLAATLRCSLQDAKRLIFDYFKAMPAIGKVMTYLGRFGVRNGYINTLAPFYRKRYFPKWEYRKQFIEEHIQGIRPDKWLGEIERASKNQPIQGSSADQTKTAICLIMWELDEKNLHDRVKLLMQVHDQIDTAAEASFAEEWKVRLTELMEEAALINVPTGLLKAETTITDMWSK